MNLLASFTTITSASITSLVIYLPQLQYKAYRDPKYQVIKESLVAKMQVVKANWRQYSLGHCGMHEFLLYFTTPSAGACAFAPPGQSEDVAAMWRDNPTSI